MNHRNIQLYPLNSTMMMPWAPNGATVEVREWISHFIPLSMWLFIHAEIKVNPCQQSAPLLIVTPQIAGNSIVCSIGCSGQKPQKSKLRIASLFARRIYRWPTDNSHKMSSKHEAFPCHGVILNNITHNGQVRYGKQERNYEVCLTQRITCFRWQYQHFYLSSPNG